MVMETRWATTQSAGKATRRKYKNTQAMPAEKRKTDVQTRGEALSPTKEARRQPEPAPAVPRTPRTLRGVRVV